MNTDYRYEQWDVRFVDEADSSPSGREDPFARPMFWLAFAYLILLACLIHRFHFGALLEPEQWIYPSAMVTLWAVIAGEAVFRWAVMSRFRWREFARSLLYIILPPLRMGAPSLLRPGQIWLPFLGWRDLDRRLPERLDAGFAGPMILFAVLVIPLVLIEYFKADMLRENDYLRAGVQFASGAIWFAFALEFTLKVSVARKTLPFLISSWLELAIVFIPTLTIILGELAKSAMVARLLRLSRGMRALNPAYFIQMGRLYRLRGLTGRAWASVLSLDLLARIMGKDPLRTRLQRLKAEEARLLDELRYVRELIAEARESITQNEVETRD